LSAALEGVTDYHPVTHTADNLRQAAEMARNRHPHIAFVERTRDLRSLKSFTEEMAVGAPDTIIVALFSPHLFSHDVSESALLIEAMRIGVRDFLRRPLSTTDLQGLLARLLRHPAPRSKHKGTVITFVSNKGGVGKSTLAVNVACALAQRRPGRVLIVDASLQMGVCSALLDLRPSTSIIDAVREKDRLDEVLIRQLAAPHDCGVHLLAAPSDAVEAAEIDEEILSRVLTLARRAYDFVLVDSFPLLDRVMIAALDLSDRAYLVLESVVPTVLGAAKLIAVLDSLGLRRERLRVILNRYSRFAGNLPPADVAARLNRDVDHVFPYEKQLLVASNLGKPYILNSRRWFNPFARAVDEVVTDIENLARGAHKSAAPAKGGAPSTNGTAAAPDKRKAHHDS
ncbi:MAG TPA: AAA family ATPase, partial [Stellaceae bacterium]|nr:AAA family ATPase [Stellaceae bacterium]